MRWGGFCGKKLGEFLKTFWFFAGDLGGLDEAAKGKAEVATVVVGRIDEATIEAEDVGEASIRAGSRGPVIAALASAVKRARVTGVDAAAPHKE